VSPTERHDESLHELEVPGPLVGFAADGDGGGEAGASPTGFEPAEASPTGFEPAGARPSGEPPTRVADRSARGPLAALLRLYRGQTSFDFVGRRRWWFLISGLVILAGVISFSVRGFNFGIDFRGGSSWQISAPGVSQTTVTHAVVAAGLRQPVVEILGGKTVEVQADLNSLPAAEQARVNAAVVRALHRFAPGQPVSISHVGPTWGGQVTQHALIALLAFFVAVGVYISLRFEPKMALAAFVALVHDLLVTAGVYSLFGFQVTPDTVVAILTILGYSLYDTVVVFDRVRDNSRGLGASGRMTYSEMVNLSMNQTLARSINTSLVAIMPVLAVLVIGAEVLGAVTLQNYGVALLVGLLSGAYSSIFIASPILAMLKEREQRYAQIRQRLAARADRVGLLTPAAAAALVGQSSGTVRPSGSRPSGGPLRPGASRQKAPVGAAAEPAAAGAGAPVARAGTQPVSRPAPRPRKGNKRGGRKRR